MGGKGGGRPDMAEGGGKGTPRNSRKALAAIRRRKWNPNCDDTRCDRHRRRTHRSGLRHRRLKKRNVPAIVIDKGCLTNSLYNYPTHMTFFTTPELLEIGEIPMTSLNEKPTRTEALKYYRRVADHYKLDIHQYELVESIGGEDNNFTVKTSVTSYHAKKVIISTGYYDVPNMLNVRGEELPKVIHYYKEPHPYYDHDVMVVGAKNSAAIAALELFWTGARATLVHRGAEIHRHVKYWIKPNIENRIKNGEVKAYFNSHVVAIHPKSVTLDTPEGRIEVMNDFVLAMHRLQPRHEDS